jgi:hypothetical protein
VTRINPERLTPNAASASLAQGFLKKQKIPGRLFMVPVAAFLFLFAKRNVIPDRIADSQNQRAVTVRRKLSPLKLNSEARGIMRKEVENRNINIDDSISSIFGFVN